VLARPIPRTGELLPVVGLGTWQAFDVGPHDAAMRALRAVVQTLADGGGRVIDSSPMYGRAEQRVGELLAGLPQRSRCWLATKVWTRGRAAGIAQMEASLALLGTTRLDLMQIHNLVDWRTHAATLAAWRDAGRVRYLGVTHYHAGAHAEVEQVVAGGAFDFVQINYSVGEPEADRTVLAAAQANGTAVLVNRPFGQGELLRRVRGQALPAWAAEIGCSTWSALLLKWILAHPAVTCVIPGTGDAAHMAEALAAADGPLPDAAMRRRIAAAARGA
jgi:diketogulonate reductase-like aldo/keto reductase